MFTEGNEVNEERPGCRSHVQEVCYPFISFVSFVSFCRPSFMASRLRPGAPDVVRYKLKKAV